MKSINKHVVVALLTSIVSLISTVSKIVSDNTIWWKNFEMLKLETSINL